MKLLLLLLLLVFTACKNTINNNTEVLEKSFSIIEEAKTEQKTTQDRHDIEIKGFFDNDEIEDILFADLIKGENESVYQCKISLGNNKIVLVKIPVASSSLQINNCKKGCIETYEWITGDDGYEETNRYLFDKKLNNWFIIKSITEENGEIEEKIYTKEQWSIDHTIQKN